MSMKLKLNVMHMCDIRLSYMYIYIVQPSDASIINSFLLLLMIPFEHFQANKMEIYVTNDDNEIIENMTGS